MRLYELVLNNKTIEILTFALVLSLGITLMPYAEAYIETDSFSTTGIPGVLEYNPNTDRIYSISENGKTFEIYDATTFELIFETTIVGKRNDSKWVDTVVDPTNNTVFLIGDAVIIYYNATNGTYLDFYQPPGNKHDFTRAALNTETGNIYVVDTDEDNSKERLFVYSPEYNTFESLYLGNVFWKDIAVNTVTDKIFLALEGDSAIQMVDDDSTHDWSDFDFDMTIGEFTAIDVDSTLNKLYVGHEGNGPYKSEIIIVDVDYIVGKIQEGEETAYAEDVTTLAVPSAKEIKIDSARNLLYMTTTEDTLFRIIDTTTDTIIGTVDIGVSGAGIAFDSANNRIFVGGDDGAIHVIQADTITTTVTKKSGGGNDQEWKSKPTFGKHFLTNVQLVECGFMFESKCFMITDNWHTPFDKIKMLTGFPYDFELNTYAQNGIKRIEIAFVPEVGAKHKAEVLFEFHFNYDKTLENIVVKQNENLVDTKILNATLTNDPEQLGMYNVKIDNIKFLEQPHFEVIAINAVDFKGRSTVTYLNEGIDVVGGSYNKPPTEQILSEEKYGGLQTITRIDKFTGIWENEQGIKYTKNDYNTWKRITPYTFERIIDSPTDVMTRTHSGFDELKEYEKLRALQYVYNAYPKLFVEATFAEIYDIFAYDFPTEETDRLANTDLQ